MTREEFRAKRAEIWQAHAELAGSMKSVYGTGNPDCARSWLWAINAMLDLTTYENPLDVLGTTHKFLEKDTHLFAQDFVRRCPGAGDIKTREDMMQIRDVLCDAFDLPVTG